MTKAQQMCHSLAEIKQRTGMSYSILSNELGVSIATLYRWIKGKGSPRARPVLRSLEEFVNRHSKKRKT